MRLKKKQKDSKKKNVNVAIKRVKSNASALAISSDSNIDEVNHAKVLLFHDNISQNVEFLEVAYNKIRGYIITLLVATPGGCDVARRDVGASLQWRVFIHCI